jgi:UDP-N-acetylmuramyl pentapeptide phosphotransferase/UDP-N-acetylglucosamine-1-phosphate transferase
VEVALELALELTVLLGVCLVISAVAIRLSVTLVSHLGIMDRPGGHKQHETSTPFVGGFGVIAVVISMPLLGKWFFVDFSILPLPGLLVGAVAIFLTGLADDIWHLGFKPVGHSGPGALSMVFSAASNSTRWVNFFRACTSISAGWPSP